MDLNLTERNRLRTDLEQAFPWLKATDVFPDLPFLVQQTGRVIGVGFDPGSKWVRIKAQDGSDVSILAQDRTVDRALEFRNEDVKVLYLDSGDGNRRLLRIQPSGEPFVRLDNNKFVFDKWRKVLEVLVGPAYGWLIFGLILLLGGIWGLKQEAS